MAIHDLSAWRHAHAFDEGNRAAERRTWIVVAITAVTMVAEIIGGWLTGSMALLADGWHMGTHVAALSIAGMSYGLARRWSADARFAFGTWKIEVLGAFSSALILGLVALAMVVESIHRLFQPESIAYSQALWVASIGLAVNIVSALLLASRDHDHDAGHAHRDDHGDHAGHHDHHDLNLRSAYVHVLADAFTSVLAIAALASGLLLGWSWMDPAMGIVGAIVIAWWSKGLLASSSRILLDREMDSPLVGEIRRAIESDEDTEIADLHVWRVGRARYACIVCVVAHEPLTPDGYRARLAQVPTLVHVSVEVNRCPHHECP
jgi:cation diffusion facilitator family transporter